jgi:hypothetical protein
MSPSLRQPSNTNMTVGKKYIMRSDGTIKFLRDAASLELLSRSAPSVPLLPEEMFASAGPSSAATSRSVSRANLLAPLSTHPNNTSAYSLSHTSLPSPLAQALLDRNLSDASRGDDVGGLGRPSVSVLSGYHPISIDEAMTKGSKLAPADHDIRGIATNGIQELREEETARLCVPASNLGLRQSAIALEASLRDRLLELHTKANSMGRFEFGQRAQRIFNDVMYEMIRQVGVQCVERAKLLATIWTRSSEIINALSAMFLDERERHATAENKLKEELRVSRKDYLLVVQQLERMVEQEFEAQTSLLADSEKRETELTVQINGLKDELQASLAKLKETERVHRIAQFQKVRPLGSVDSYGLDTLPALDTVSPFGEVNTTSSSASLKASPSKSFSKSRRSSSAVDDADEEEEITPQMVASLKAELQRQRVLLLDAVEEVRSLKGDAPNSQTKGTMAVPTTAEVGLDPCEELATESDSEEDDDTASVKSLGRRGSRTGRRMKKK